MILEIAVRHWAGSSDHGCSVGFQEAAVAEEPWTERDAGLALQPCGITRAARLAKLAGWLGGAPGLPLGRAEWFAKLAVRLLGWSARLLSPAV